MLTEISIPEKVTQKLGLQPVELHSLKAMVVLAGPNGAGKTRYLRLLDEVVRQFNYAPRRIKDLQVRIDVQPPASDFWRASGGVDGREEMQKDLAEVQEYRRMIRATEAPGREVRVIKLKYDLPAADALKLSEPLSVPPSSIGGMVEGTRQGGFDPVVSAIRVYFYKVAKAFYDTLHPIAANNPTVQQSLEDAKAFNRILGALLGAQVDYTLNSDSDVIARLRGRPFDPRELSQGELVLTVWAVILHRQREWLQGAHLLIDEPENHLHPDVCIRVLKALREDVLGPEGQIWLATHSVPLIAYAGMEVLHLVENGSIRYAGNRVEHVLNRLLGGEEGRSKLRSFMADADEIAFDHFAAQCLLPPSVASAQENDPQQTQMMKAASLLSAGKENVRILDFAAGRGRLAAALKNTGPMTNRRFTYYAFQDPGFSDARDRDECLEHVRSLGQPGDPKAYLVDTLEGFTVRDAERMDLVVMCNVLHEIPVNDWQHAFMRIHGALVEDGNLVILEDQSPSVGELPHENGYVILNELALKHLFDSKDAVLPVSVEREGRLTAFAIPKRFLKQVSPATIGRALHSVKRMAEDNIRLIRGKRREERSFQDGRLHAHFTLLYANAQLASREFPDPDEKS